MGGGNRFFSDHPELNYDGPSREAIIQDGGGSSSRTGDLSEIKKAQLKVLNELHTAISMHEPSFRHQQNSSFDSGKANGLRIAIMYIDIKIKELL